MVELTDGSFEQEVLKNALPTIVDFWAPWCAPCRALAPILEDLEKDYVGKAKFTKYNTDEYSKLCTDYRVSSIPALIIFRDGKVVKQSVGFESKEDLKKILDTL